MSVKKSLKAGVKGAYDPIGGTKDSLAIGKRDLNLNKPTADTSAQDAILAQQKTDAAELDSEENRRRKRLLSNATGIRGFAGSPLFRATPSNTAGRAAGAAAAVAGASVGAGGGGSVYAGGAGSGGGGRRGGGRSLMN